MNKYKTWKECAEAFIYGYRATDILKGNEVEICLQCDQVRGEPHLEDCRFSDIRADIHEAEIAKLKAAGDALIDEAERVALANHAPEWCMERFGDECACNPNLKRAIKAWKEATNDQTS